MQFITAVKTCFRKYSSGIGRASRSEFWYWNLFTFLAGIVLAVMDVLIFGTGTGYSAFLSPLQLLFNFTTLLPSICVMIRRLHDVDKSGWWMLISFTLIGLIPLFIWNCKQGTPGSNRFGEEVPA